MDGSSKVVFFHVCNVHSEEGHTLKAGDDVTFNYDEYEKGAIDVQLEQLGGTVRKTQAGTYDHQLEYKIGTIKWFNPLLQYGFIIMDGSKCGCLLSCL